MFAFLFPFLFLFSNLSGMSPQPSEDMTIYKVYVKTGDKRGAGTDADVFIVFVGSEGESGINCFV